MKPNPQFLVSGVGATTSAQWEKPGIKTHVAVAALSNEDAEIARDCLIPTLFREMKWPKAKVSFTRKGDEAVFTSDNFAWRICLDLDGEHSLADNLAASKRVSHFAH